MSNTFWAVFLGSGLGTFTVHLAIQLVEEWRDRQSHKRIHQMLEDIEDSEFEEYEGQPL
jgi:hypothetical protein